MRVGQRRISHKSTSEESEVSKEMDRVEAPSEEANQPIVKVIYLYILFIFSELICFLNF